MANQGQKTMYLLTNQQVKLQLRKPRSKNQGASLSIFQAVPAILYTILSCKRLGRPCQNSIISGFTIYPPQYGGLGICFPAYFCKKSRSLSISSLSEIGWL